MHRILSRILFSRADTVGGVTNGELLTLHAMLYEEHRPVNIGRMLIDHLLCHAAQTDGNITVSGIISFLVDKMGVDLEFYDEIECDDLFGGRDPRERILIFQLP